MKDLTGVLQEAEAEISVVCYYLCVAVSVLCVGGVVCIACIFCIVCVVCCVCCVC